ncbi:DUF7114 family protein [Natrinema salsiterrestre]|uniref:Uncharacterized protein n=1 Tax=Natrinema salsiterrestre TaxID=2950540 RepID=A0A9Q4L5B3_9EURY|nr:hypothetical protein [Natrinema salsiterrestre]MDF9747574.1 hypothetical protein [Natrinema salsiterrestre]
MENADSCRRAAAEAVADVEPSQLHDYIEATLERASMVPGTLTLESAAMMAAEGRVSEDDRYADSESGTEGGQEPVDDETRDHELDGVVTHAAGVQLIYEGLRLTRSLSHEEPWTASDADAGDGDLAILAADILVARGFYLLARTDAAGKAVRTVQSFGRDQTRRTELAAGDRDLETPSSDRDADTETAAGVDTDGTDPASIDANLERDVLELAVLTGAVAVGTTPSPRLLAIAERLADAVSTSFPPAEEYLDDLEPSIREQSLEDHVTDRATSATDP